MHVFDTRTHRARKTHQCATCFGEIRPGESYGRTGVIYDGSWWDWAEHHECRAEVERLLRRYREDEYPEGALAGERWTDEDWSPKYRAWRESRT